MKKKLLFTLGGAFCLFFLIGFATDLFAADYSTVNYASTDFTAPADQPLYVEGKIHYSANRAPLKPSPFMKLPVGAVQPKGWLRSNIERMRDGMPGKLSEFSPWLKKDNNAWLSAGGEFGWEEVPYWLRGYADMAFILDEAPLVSEATFWLGKMMETQKENGYFGTGDPGDLWPNMLVLFTLQSYYERTKDPTILDFMTRYFRWVDTVPDEHLLESYWENQRAGDMLYSCLWLYNQTGDEQLLKTAEKIRNNTANWWGQTLPCWHNVNIAECFRTPAVWWMVTGDQKDLRAAYNNFWCVRAAYGQVPGGMFGGDENSRPGYIDPRQGVETCGIFEQMTSDMILTRVTGDTFWADQAEDVAFNSAPACMLPDFKGLRYLTCPNQPISDSANHQPSVENGGNMMGMSSTECFRCCQHNHTHGWPYYVENLWLATPDGGLAAALYGASVVTAQIGDGQVATFFEETNYPFDETINLTFSTGNPPEADVVFPLYLRVPGWCEGMTVAINGEKVDYAPQAGTWFRINRLWRDGDKVAVSLPMSFAFRTWQQNKNSVSLNYGPLTFSLKIKENYVQKRPNADPNDSSRWPEYDILPDSTWNYGLVDPASLDLSQLKLVKKAWPADQYPWTVDAVPYSVKLEGKQVPQWGLDETGLCAPLPFSPAKTSAPAEELELIPMGAARLRITAFPTVEK